MRKDGVGMNINFTPLILFALLGITLGVWKLAEIVIYIFHHLRWA